MTKFYCTTTLLLLLLWLLGNTLLKHYVLHSRYLFCYQTNIAGTVSRVLLSLLSTFLISMQQWTFTASVALFLCNLHYANILNNDSNNNNNNNGTGLSVVWYDDDEYANSTNARMHFQWFQCEGCRSMQGTWGSGVSQTDVGLQSCRTWTRTWHSASWNYRRYRSVRTATYTMFLWWLQIRSSLMVLLIISSCS